VVVFVKQQHGPLLLPLVLHVVENLIGVNVFTPSGVVVPNGLKINYIPNFESAAVGFKIGIGSNV
jgi:hypothetical protein